jgi:hypothetical protein
MSTTVKILIGLAAAWLAAWINHGPAGNGARIVDALQAQAEAVVTRVDLPGVTVQVQRDPFARVAILSGPADEFQRNGMGGLKGLTQLVAEIEGIKTVRWADQPQSGVTVPLLAESLIAATIAFLIGLGLGWLLWGRPPRERYA